MSEGLIMLHAYPFRYTHTSDVPLTNSLTVDVCRAYSAILYFRFFAISQVPRKVWERPVAVSYQNPGAPRSLPGLI